MLLKHVFVCFYVYTVLLLGLSNLLVLNFFLILVKITLFRKLFIYTAVQQRAVAFDELFLDEKRRKTSRTPKQLK